MSGQQSERYAPYPVVYKWPMTTPVIEVDMPADARVIDVRTQDNVPTLWTLGTEDGQVRRRTFVGFGTGHPIGRGLVYVGSAHDVEGWMVFHIFERPTHSDNGAPS